ncbi:FkbM family methyltransferase [Roseospira marina]|nr:FkbM family methyltransferase [Roseospira marina]MBB4314421.1 FkbM family methyltransferase [Roseospira marina]MBB5087581.1 FkbM family methyltransferase [Roseospira marina]
MRAIYGAGRQGQFCLEGLRKHGLDADFFIDSYTPNTEVSGLKVYRIKDVPNPDSVQVFVAISDNVTYGQSIDGVLRSAGFREIYDIDYILRNYEAVFLNFSEKPVVWYKGSADGRVDTSGIKALRSLLKDPKSQMLLNRIIRFRSNFHHMNYVESDNEVEYFPSDVPFHNENIPLIFADCGAFRGETVAAALENWKGPKQAVCCFEANRFERENLEACLTEHASKTPETHFYLCPMATWSSNTTLTFDGSMGMGSSVVPGAEGAEGGASAAEPTASPTQIRVPAMPLDAVFQDTPPTMIKMDIEGAEIEALKGASSIISETAPILAICLYHEPEHLWEIPILIHSMQKNYDMYLRVHSLMCMSTVLYCVPKRDGRAPTPWKGRPSPDSLRVTGGIRVV